MNKSKEMLMALGYDKDKVDDIVNIYGLNKEDIIDLIETNFDFE